MESNCSFSAVSRSRLSALILSPSATEKTGLEGPEGGNVGNVIEVGPIPHREEQKQIVQADYRKESDVESVHERIGLRVAQCLWQRSDVP